MEIVNLMIEEKKLVDKIETRKREIFDLHEKVNKLQCDIERDNIKAIKHHKNALEGAGKLIIKER